MYGRVLFFLAAGLLVSMASQASEIRADAVSSAALGRPYKFTVYLPDGYPGKGAGRYPVLYLHSMAPMATKGSGSRRGAFASPWIASSRSARSCPWWS